MIPTERRIGAAAVGGAAETLTNNALSNNGTEKDRTHSGVVQITSIFGTAVANDLRFSTTYELRPRTANEHLPTVSNTIGQFGSRNFLPTTQDDTRVQINDGISISRSRHLFKFGGDYNYLTTFQLFGFNQFGFFGFNTSNVADILEIMSLGGPTANRFDSPLVTYQRQIGNLAALNLKENVTATIENCLFRDSEIAFRVRGPGDRGGAQVSVRRCAIYDTAVGVRVEDHHRRIESGQRVDRDGAVDAALAAAHGERVGVVHLQTGARGQRHLLQAGAVRDLNRFREVRFGPLKVDRRRLLGPGIDDRVTHMLAEETVRQPGVDVRPDREGGAVETGPQHGFHPLDALLGHPARPVHVRPHPVDVLRLDDAAVEQALRAIAPAVV